MVIAGIGLGLMMQVFVLSVQNAVPSSQMGSATALTQFARSIGATRRRDGDGRDRQPGPAVGRARERGVSSTGCRPTPASRSRTRCTRRSSPRPPCASSCSSSSLVGVKEVPLRKGLEEPTLAVELGRGGGGGEPVPTTRR